MRVLLIRSGVALRAFPPFGWPAAGSVCVSEAGSGPEKNAQAWMYRQNIARYRALLANPARRDSHEQIRSLLAEEQEKLRSLGESDAAPGRDNPV